MTKESVDFDGPGNPWDRQPGERDAPWQAFKLYRDMGPSRSARKVAMALKKSSGHLLRYSHAWSWKERIQAYETHMDRVSQKAHEIALEEMAADHAKAGRIMMVTALKVITAADIKDIKISDAIAMFRAAIPVERQGRLAGQAYVPRGGMSDLLDSFAEPEGEAPPQTGP